jgi:DNA (cytosine-5)-methyltransferase 1
MRYLSVCSGIEAASVAWHPLGWTPVAFSEVEPFPSAVLAHHYPETPNWGDMTRFKEWPDADVDVLVGGTPCQAFSVAGLRRGLADPRGNLTLTYLAIAARYRPRWLVWENVPGVLSDRTGAFGSLLGGLAELGYGWAYRILDAQYFGLAQRRRRVFVVGCLGDWRRAAAVLFERESLRGDSAPRRKAREVAPTIPARSAGSGGLGTDVDCDGGVIAMAHGQGGAEIGFDRGPTLTCNHEAPIIAHSLRGEGFDASEDGTGRGTPLVPVQPYTLAIRGRGDSHNLEYRQDGVANALLTPNGGRGGIGVGAIAFDTTQITSAANYSNPKPGDPCHPLAAGAHAPAVAFDILGTPATNGTKETDIHTALRARPLGASEASTTTVAMSGMQVRRLTPVECEKLQGFLPNYTAISWRGKPASECPDGARYKALGNSMAVPCMRWIGERIETVNDMESK